MALTGLNGYNEISAIPLKCVSMGNQERRVRPVIMNTNNNEPLQW